MANPTLRPHSTASVSVLPQTASTGDVVGLPFGIYTGSVDFIQGCADQVAYTYKKLGGDVLDLEITTGSVFSSYEEAVLEYSCIVNIHQAKNVLSDVLGDSTGTFNHDGELQSGDLSSSLGGTHVTLKYPKFDFTYSRRVASALGNEAGLGGSETVYSASLNVTGNQQDYDLQKIIHSASTNSDEPFFGHNLNNRKVVIREVYYKTPHVMWRFYGYYGGLNVVGNLANYGQYADDSSFQIVPVWQNKLQARAFEDAIYTRLSHFSYEIKNNRLRLFPPPESTWAPDKFWVHFSVPTDAWEEEDDRTTGIDGVNNMNTIPFANVPYENINSIGKQWIRRFALSLSKETLGQIRSKFSTIPIPGESVSLNGSDLMSQGKEEQEKLREELKTVLDELTYDKLMQSDASLVESTSKIQMQVPNLIFMG